MPQPIQHAIETWARQRPEDIALIDDDGPVTFRELVTSARRYAGALIALGIRPSTIVPVLMDRSARQAAVLLGVLYAGAAYSVLDPSWPAARIAEIRAALGDTPLLTDLAEGTAPERLPVVAPGDPACVFFTSGSTGAPKGVVTPHRAVTRLTDGGPLARLGPGRVMPQVAPVAWDAAGFELWSTLGRGGTVVLTDTDHLLAGDVRDLTGRFGVNTITLAGSLFNLLVQQDVECFAGIDLVFIGGERLAPNPVREFLHRWPGTALFNCYGPVESCAFTTLHRIGTEDCDRPGGIPIGRPLPHTGVHLRDGELLISGDGLAIGYLGDPRETERRFVTVPVNGFPTRLYRTGDRARRDPDGLLHFLGRADRQVKIRGHRVEPAALESVARATAGVLDCAAVPLAGSDGAFTRLALVYAARHGSAVPGLRDRLRGLLPGHLVPDVVRAVPELPRSAHGKVDHRAIIALLTGSSSIPEKA